MREVPQIGQRNNVLASQMRQCFGHAIGRRRRHNPILRADDQGERVLKGAKSLPEGVQIPVRHHVERSLCVGGVADQSLVELGAFGIQL